MTEVKMTPDVLQQLLIINGYNLGKAGADGVWGNLTKAAAEQWFKDKKDLLNPSEVVDVPTGKIDRQKFFDSLRGDFKQKYGSGFGFTESQVAGTELIIDEWETRKNINVQMFAYLLTTAWWESGKTMQPVREGFYISTNFNTAEAWRKRNLRYYPYYGRGLVQLTWDYNYKKASALYGVDFLKNPDLALDPVYSVKIIFDGMLNGWFTSKAMDDFIDDIDETDDEDLREYINARKVVNGTDKAKEIGQLALIFEKAIKAGL